MKYFVFLFSVCTIGIFLFPNFVLTRSVQTILFDPEERSLKLNRTKRDGKIYNTVALRNRFPEIAQVTAYYCAPAVLEAILRYLNVDFRRLPDRDSNAAAQIRSLTWQSSLGAQLETSIEFGTSVNNIAPALNYLVNDYSPEYIHGYAISLFNRRNFDLQADHFYDVVYESLSHNFPVVFIHHGGFGRFIYFFNSIFMVSLLT